MTPIEKKELADRIKAMDADQIALVMSCVPDDAIIYELQLRLGAFRKFFEDVYKTTENALNE